MAKDRGQGEQPEVTRAVKLSEWESQMDEGFVGFHEAANIFPAMTDEEFEAFKEDIRENGLLSPIVTTPDGQILDGRHRWRACMQTETEPRYQVYRGNPWTYVISANLHRRHLSTSQRGMVGARIAIRERGQHDAVGSGKGMKSRISRVDLRPPTRDQAAKLLNVGSPIITQGRHVMKKGIPELTKVVDDGVVPMNTAARIASMSEDVQKEFVERIKAGEKPRHIAPVTVKGGSYAKANKNVIKIRAFDRFTKINVDSLDSTLRGIILAFGEITEIDEKVTPVMARSLISQIKQAKSVLTKLNRLLDFVSDEDSK